MGHAEMLFFVDDQQAKVLEFDVLRQQSVRADNDIDIPGSHAFFGFRDILGCYEARKLSDLQRPVRKSVRKRLKVLAAEQRRGYDDRHLMAGHGRHERRPQCHFRFTEAHIAAHQPVHGALLTHIGQHIFNRVFLILRFLEREPGAEFRIDAMGRLDRLGMA